MRRIALAIVLLVLSLGAPVSAGQTYTLYMPVEQTGMVCYLRTNPYWLDCGHS